MTETPTKGQILSMPAGPEMDALVAERVMGLKRVGRGSGLPGMPGVYYIDLKTQYDELFPPCYSTDIAAAWEVVGKLRIAVARLRHWNYQTKAYTEAWWAKPLGDHTDSEVWYENGDEASAETAPLAICRAALLAVVRGESE